MGIEKIDWEQRYCLADGHRFSWSAPRFDEVKKRVILTLRESGIESADASESHAFRPAFRRDISVLICNYSDDHLHFRIVSEIEKALCTLACNCMPDETLGDYLSTPGMWERIREFFGWSLNTARNYINIIRHVFSSVLVLSYRRVQPSDIEGAIEENCSSCEASSIRTYLKVINRVFVYLGFVFPGLENPVRFNGRRIREARVDQKLKNALMRVSQHSLYNFQAKKLLFSFLSDIKKGDYRGIPALMMLETGRRPKEAGATTLGMHTSPLGESFLSAKVFGADDTGNINCTRKNGRANRMIPDSPIVRAVFDYIYHIAALEFCSTPSVKLKEFPFGYKIVRREGKILNIKAFPPKMISSYVKEKLIENDIDFIVPVDSPEDDTDDNRRAYILRHTAETCLAVFLTPELLQYVFGHKRADNPKNAEAHANDPEYYLSPQVQQKIYHAMVERDHAVYGESIVEDVKNYLYSNEPKKNEPA